MVGFMDKGAKVFDYGNSIRGEAKLAGYDRAFDFPGFVPAYIRPLFCRGVGPFRWAALSGDPEDIARTDAKVRELMPHDRHLMHWLDMAQQKIKFQGLPARICWVGLGDRHRLGLAFNEMVASGELKAPIVIGRDHSIFGYTIINDVTALDVLNADPSFPQWARAKSFASFGPMGPCIATDIDLATARVKVALNGRVRQDYPLSDMIFPPARIVEMIGAEMALAPGDVIACGTSLGALPMRPGMVVEVTIDGIGTLRNTMAGGE
jgi:hypothetical protein